MSVFGVILGVFSSIRNKYGEILDISPYLFRMPENTEQNSSEYGNLSFSVYDIRNKGKFHLRAIKSITFGSKMLSHLTPKIWELVQVEIKNVESVACFKRAIQKWDPMNCSCCLCRTYIAFFVIYFVICYNPYFMKCYNMFDLFFFLFLLFLSY